MTTTDAAIEILRRAGGGPLHVYEIADRVLASGLVTLHGKTPRDSITARLYVEAAKPEGRVQRTAAWFRLNDRP